MKMEYVPGLYLLSNCEMKGEEYLFLTFNTFIPTPDDSPWGLLQLKTNTVWKRNKQMEGIVIIIYKYFSLLV